MKKFIISFSLFAAALFAQAADAPKYIFYFIGDGMGLGHVLAAQTYWRQHVDAQNPLPMFQFPIIHPCTSHSFSNTITDSAAAGSALSTGVKTRNGMLGVDSDTIPTQSVAAHLKELGDGVAIASSVPIDDATPGAFYAHVASRKMFTQIGLDMAKSQYDIFAGGALRGLKDSKGNDTGLEKALTDAGYSIAYGPKEFENVKDRNKLILLSTDKTLNIGFTIDSIKNALTLPYITKACIDHVMRVSPDKFFIMIEGGNIDWAAHSNDGATVIKEIVNFSQCIQQALDFYNQHPDETLIIVTADHNTGGMSMGTYEGPHYEVNFKNVEHQKISAEEFQKVCSQWQKRENPITWEEVKEFLSQNLGFYSKIQLTDAENEQLQKIHNDLFNLHQTSDTKTLYSTFSSFTSKALKIFQNHAGIGWTTYSHCGDYVPFFAIGKGSENFKGHIDNTDIPTILKRITK